MGWCSKAINPIDLLFPHKSFHHTMLSRYIATSLHRYIISSFVPPQELPPYYTLPLHHYITTSLHRYIATSLHCYIATSLHRYIATSHTLAYFGILWHTLAYSLHCYFATSVHHFFFCSPTRASTILCSLATLLLRYIGTSFLQKFE